MASAEAGGDKYRSFMYGEGEKNTVWRHGAPPNYDMVNKLFEEERTQVLSLIQFEFASTHILHMPNSRVMVMD